MPSVSGAAHVGVGTAGPCGDLALPSGVLDALPPPGTGYFVAPLTGPGPGVLLVPSAWGLTPSIKQRADNLADAGFSVLVPDVNDGVVATTEAEADEALMSMDINVAASLTQSSLRLLQRATANPAAPLGVVGFGSGASWALWISARMADSCACVVSFYGTQSIEFTDASASYLLHFGTDDAVVDDADIAMLGLNLQLAGRAFDVVHHDNAKHGFAEAEHPNHDAAVDAVAWRQSLEFLANHLK